MTIAAIVGMIAAAGPALCIVLFLDVALFGVGGLRAFGAGSGPTPVLVTPTPAP